MDLQTSRGRRVAFFGGSFDPPHLGHLAVARAAQTALDLDAVLFAPVGAQPLKPKGSTAAFIHRLAMTRLAIASEPGFAVSLADAPTASGAPNYTLETLLALRAELPPESDLFCLMGADAFAGLKGWHRAAEIPFAAPLIVASRPGQRLHDWKTALPEGLSIEAVQAPVRTGLDVEIHSFLLRNVTGDRAPFYLLPGLEIEISASEIRDQMRNREQARAGAGDGTPGRELLPSAVLDYICAHGLYR
ncbi:MAG: nicotinate (nicotinamide) nucleotide adenylyltransferase [Terracidiphilus sp.]